MVNAKDLINWGELSRRLAGSRFTIRKNNYPKKHEALILDLEIAIEEVFKKHGKNEQDLYFK